MKEKTNIKKLTKKITKQAKGITLIALVVTIIVLLILAGVAISLSIGNNGIFKRAQNSVEVWDEASKNEQDEMDKAIGAIDGVDGNYNEDKKVNAPALKTGMTPVKFTEVTSSKKGEAVKTNEQDSDWYSYENKKWANAQTQDGSMWVWIPRYAYRIDNSTKTTDVVFLIGTSDNYYDEQGKLQTAKRCKTKDEKVDTTTGYTVHPAFTNETSIEYRNGGWDRELTGIWVSKFEAAYATSGETANKAPVKESSVVYTSASVWAPKIEVQGVNTDATGDGSIQARNWLDGVYEANKEKIKYPTFQGSSYSMNYITINDANNISRALTEPGNIYGLSNDTDSHLMKNSEWGACTYLARSKTYGIGKSEIAVNNKNLNNGGVSTTKEQGNTKASAYAVTGYNANNNEWNSYLGSNLSASTTGNIYGIYDMSGGTWERTASYINNGKTGNGASVVVGKEKSTKYATVYPYSDVGANDDEKSVANYKLNDKIYGDSVRETSTEGKGSTSWYGDYSYFPEGGHPFFARGGYYGCGGVAGLSAFIRANGHAGWYPGFRSVLV